MPCRNLICGSSQLVHVLHIVTLESNVILYTREFYKKNAIYKQHIRQAAS